MQVSIKHAQCGALLMVVKDLNVELPLAIYPTDPLRDKLCSEFKCIETNSPCEALVALLRGDANVVLTSSNEVREAVKEMVSLIPIGRAFQVVDYRCRMTSHGLEMLKNLELECPDYSYDRALFIADELSPSIHFLITKLKRAQLIEGEKLKINCGLEIPKGLEVAYPFSQLECPKSYEERLREEIFKKLR
ncbi:hypothetical protein EYM_06915 [Ignicoccus islandicus DSM 13165]|uniref:Uncharacterized protein n=1 Tax=Ignicoccus islandicus DSM 13165 TaxID=940295 RepID=A0A0U2WP60_9CREN|nr:hypothetical protein [Ignicoccus islandicus]ALU12737.1 hypothetical protein EYM_06915 [Ignicoccus islandicus DSM 13165]